MKTFEIVEMAADKGLVLTTAESCTGGMVAAELTEIPGASDILTHGFVTYSNRAKTQMLGVDPELFPRVGAVSEEVAAEMAVGALNVAEADIAVSITGVAGPGASGRKPEGMVCFGLATPAGVETMTVQFGPLGRDRVRSAATRQALDLLAQAVKRA